MLAAADLFCGLGGFTQGAEDSGHVRTALAVNHWRPAAYAFRANHPEARVLCARIEDVDPRNDRTLPELDVLLASPECTHHSIARGGQPVEDQKRATPWHVAWWVEAKRPRFFIVENVAEFRTWGPLRARKKHGRVVNRPDGRPCLEPDPKQRGRTFSQWVNSLQSLGYHVDHQVLCAADYGAPTTRRRLFIVGIRDDCYRGEIPWPTPTHSREQWTPASSIIDWAKPCPSIFDRKRPLAENTLKRIEYGLRKFVEPFLVKMRGTGQANSVHDPLGTVTAGGKHYGLAVPFQLKAAGRCPGLTRGIEQPVPTIVASRLNHAVVVPWVIDLAHSKDNGRGSSIGQPMPALTTKHTHGLVCPYLVTSQHGERDGQTPRVASIEDPVRTVTTKRGEGLVFPFLTKYYGTGVASPISDPVDTVTTRGRFGLALVHTMRELGIVDIGYRMLSNQELLHAQGFPEGYSLDGAKSQAEQTKLIGNAVPPAFSRAICGSICERGLVR